MKKLIVTEAHPTLIDLIRPHFPDIVAEFEHAPWDYNVIGTLGLEEPAQFLVRLDVGKTKSLKRTFTFTVYADGTVLQTHYSTEKVKS